MPLKNVVISLTADQLRAVGETPVECSLKIDGVSYPCAIHVRGNSSQFVPKKGYALDFIQPVNIFGFGAYDKWVILGELFDNTYIRNQLTYHQGRQLGLLSPPFENFNLETTELLGPFYFGLYSLTRKFECQDIPGHPDVIVSFDRPDPKDNLYPPDNDGDSVPVISDWNKAKYSKDEIRAKYTPLYKYFRTSNVDWPSFIDYFILSETSSNGDAYVYSAYTYVLHSKIYAGFLWDYNIAYGNAVDVFEPFYQDSRFWSGRLRHLYDVPRYYRNFKFACSAKELAPTFVGNYIHDEKMYVAKTETTPNLIEFSLNCVDQRTMSAWYMALLRKPRFVQQLVARYKQLRQGVLCTKNILNDMDAFSRAVVPDCYADIRNWVNKTVLTNVTCVPIPPSQPADFYKQSVAYMKWWVTHRMRWLDRHIARPVTSKSHLNDWRGYWKALNRLDPKQQHLPFAGAAFKS
jgi:hypothetical protein